MRTLSPRLPVLCTAYRAKPTKRTAGHALQRDRAALIAERPLCAHCLQDGIVRAGVERDHIIPLANGGSDTPQNTQLLCVHHHAAKTAQENRHRYKA